MSSDRDETIDVARAIAIVAIVLGHTLRGMAAAGLIDEHGAGFVTADRTLYLFHLSVFTLLAGVFVSRGADRDGVRGYVLRRDAQFLYLYLVWGLLQGLVKVATSSLVNVPKSMLDVFKIWVPEGQLWFLPFLVVLTTLVVPWTPWRSRPVAVAVGVAGVAVSVAWWGLPGPWTAVKGFGLTAFFVAGTLVGADRFLRLTSSVSPTSAVVTLVGAFGIFATLIAAYAPTPPTTMGQARTPTSVALGIAASIAGTVAVLALSRLLALTGAAARALAFIGARSLEIFLAHIVFAAGTRIVLVRMGLHANPLVLMACVTAGVAGPLLLVRLARPLRLVWLFHAPFLGRQGVKTARLHGLTRIIS